MNFEHSIPNEHLQTGGNVTMRFTVNIFRNFRHIQIKQFLYARFCYDLVSPCYELILNGIKTFLCKKVLLAIRNQIRNLLLVYFFGNLNF